MNNWKVKYLKIPLAKASTHIKYQIINLTKYVEDLYTEI